MKIKITSFSIGLGAVLLSSCLSLNEEPKGLIAPETLFTSTDGINTAVAGIYYQLYNNYEGFDYAYPLLVGAGAEDISTVHSYPVFKGLDDLQPTPDTYALAAVWRISYLAISGSNNVISTLQSSSLDPGELDPYLGEVRFIRAFCYFNLTRWFGRVPLVTEQNQLNADRVDEAREEDIYAQIIEDLQFAEQVLTSDVNLKSRPTKAAAKGLLAKVYLTMAGYPINDPSKYTLAREKAAEVMALGYSLEPNFSDLWLAEKKLTNSELIFGFFGAYNNAAVGSHLHVASRPWEGESGWGDFFSEPRFYESFPEGPRKDASFLAVFKDGTPWQESQEAMPFIAKYRDAGRACGADDTQCSNDGEGFFPVLRYADILLMFAEAANQADGGPSEEAYNAVNQVRRRAAGEPMNEPNPSIDLEDLSKNEFENEVMNERHYELAFEGNRWFDLVRKQKVVEVNVDLYPHVAAHNHLLPKPASELAVSKGVINQNPGY